jgi:hypothetical protein
VTSTPVFDEARTGAQFAYDRDDSVVVIQFVDHDDVAYSSSVVLDHELPVGLGRLDPDRVAFAELAETWRRETRGLSLMHQKALHPSYQRIIGMGERAIPFILDALATDSSDWHWALTAITGATPLADVDRGQRDRIRAAWLKWARERGAAWYVDATRA